MPGILSHTAKFLSEQYQLIAEAWPDLSLRHFDETSSVFAVVISTIRT